MARFDIVYQTTRRFDIPLKVLIPFSGYDQACMLAALTPTGYSIFECVIPRAEEQPLIRYILRTPSGELKPSHEYNDRGHIRMGRPPVASRASRWTRVHRGVDF